MLLHALSLALIFPLTLTSCALQQDRDLPGDATIAEASFKRPAKAKSPLDIQPDATMLRYPDVSATHVVFVYANDLWTVPREGGQATPLASPAGQESYPKFSADGRTIGFVGNYEGNQDLYTIPTLGGTPKRITHHPSREILNGWTPEGDLLYSTNGFAGLGRMPQLVRVSSEGGLPEVLPVPYGTNGSVSEDGLWLAYTPHSRDTRTWKRYRGGMASDIWVFNLQDSTSKKVTEWEGTDTIPMWHGNHIYYLSDDGPSHRLNIWRLDPVSDEREQVTAFAEYDVKWPSMGPGPQGEGEIVFQNGSQLYLLNLATGDTQSVPTTIPGDRPTIRSRQINASKNITNGDISSTGKRAVLEARGDIWTVPAKKGLPRNLTRTDAVAERSPSWSPDKKWIAYFSDATGEYELYLTQSDGKGETKKLTDTGASFLYAPAWSPDSKWITFCDQTGALHLIPAEGGEVKTIDVNPMASPITPSWSHDSDWFTYSRMSDNFQGAIFLYNVADGISHQVTSGYFSDSNPVFDRKGDFLYFSTNRQFSSPVYSDVSGSFVYTNSEVLAVVPLRDEVGSPWAPKIDEETWEEPKEEKKKEPEEGKKEDKNGAKKEEKVAEKKEEKKEEKKGLHIELEGFEQRAIPLPVKRGGFSNLAVNSKGHLMYGRRPPRGGDGQSSIKIFDVKDEKKKEKTVVSGTGSFGLTPDGKKMLVYKSQNFYILNASAGQKLTSPIPIRDMNRSLDPRAEWRQMFVEAWRLQRDFFYDPNMHGVDWEGVRERYQPMIEDCVSRQDVNFVIGEMISEINVGHAYIGGGDMGENAPRRSVGMLGADYELHDGAYRISKIIEGAPWDLDARGPLSQPGVDVNVGDYLLEVNGMAVDSNKDPWAAFQGLAGKVVTLTVSSKPTKDDDAREVILKPMGSESNLRYRNWVEENRAYVEEKSGGRVGYIYVPNTGIQGQNELFRQFFGQINKEALIIDERWNGGGQIPTRFIELLNRPRTNYWARRDGKDWPWPIDSHQGPKCMLINGLAGSGGDAFPYYFRQAGLGQLIGMRTWGGLVGISGNPGLIDGGRVTVPTFAFYENDGTWGVEGHGVDPDIEVVDDPALMVNGGDPQLDVAIERMLEEIKDNPYKAPARPAYPDRSGMGIAGQDS